MFSCGKNPQSCFFLSLLPKPSPWPSLWNKIARVIGLWRSTQKSIVFFWLLCLITRFILKSETWIIAPSAGNTQLCMSDCIPSEKLPPFGCLCEVHAREAPPQVYLSCFMVWASQREVPWCGHLWSLCWMMASGWHTVTQPTDVTSWPGAAGLIDLSVRKHSETKCPKLMMVIRTMRKPGDQRGRR